MRNRLYNLAAGTDMSGGFKDFFDTIGLTGAGLVTKAIGAVIAVLGIAMLLKVNSDPKTALRKGGLGLGVLFIAVVLVMYGDTLFSTVTNAKVS
ncbi:hypothetical protein [Streptomyces rubiginosohelvolus]|uniref:hypothetical protein n=1 Tax=Streptomyces rubiginosohelvolus TaxID=67362 RepID=UPI00381E214B